MKTGRRRRRMVAPHWITMILSIALSVLMHSFEGDVQGCRSKIDRYRLNVVGDFRRKGLVLVESVL